MRLLDFVRLLVRSALVMGIVILAGAVSGLLASRAEAPQYQSTALLMVTAVPQFSAAEGQSANALAQSRAQLLVQLAQSDRVLNAVRAQLTVTRPLATLRRAVTASAVDESNFVSLSLSAATPAQAAEGATALTNVLQAEGEAIDSSLVDGAIDADIVVDVVSAAQPPEIAFAPQPRNYVIAGGVAGLALSVGSLLLRDLVSRRVWGPDDARRLVPEAPIAVLRRAPGRRRGRPDWTSDEVRFLRNDIVGMFGPRSHLVLVDVGHWPSAAHLGPQLVSALREVGLPARLIAANPSEVANPAAGASGGPISRATSALARRTAPVARGSTSLSVHDGQSQHHLPTTDRPHDGYDVVYFGSLLDATDFLATGSRDSSVVLHLRAGLSSYAAALSAVEHLTTMRARPKTVVVSGVRGVDRNQTIARTTRGWET